MEKDLLSVVIPTYNRASTILRAVGSALEQGYSPIEVIVIDDGSKDNTAEVMKNYQSDPRVRYIRQENSGVCGARNHGIRIARGEFVAMLDCDDYWLPGKLAQQMPILKAHPELSLIWSDMDAIDSPDHVVSPRYLRKMYEAYRFFPRFGDLFDRQTQSPNGTICYIGDLSGPMTVGNLIHTSTVIARAERLKQAGEYDSSNSPAEDQDFYQRVCKTGKVGYLDAVTIHYMTGAADAATAPSQGVKLARSYLRVFEGILARDGRDKIRLPAGLIDTALADGYLWAGYATLNQGDLKASRQYLLRVLKIRPTDHRALKYLLASIIPKNFLQKLRKRMPRV